MKHTLLLFATALLLGIQSYAQTGVAINTTGAEPHHSAMLDVTSTEKGILIPRMTQDERLAIVLPAKGLLVYQNDGTEGFYYYDGSAWKNLSLVNFTESNFIYNLRTGVKFTPNNAATDVDLVLQPKRFGAIIAQQPDGTATGGNKRGALATDLQRLRTDAAKVASGNYATIVGGQNNTASGDYSTAMGSDVTASGLVSTAMGSLTTASGNRSTAMGSVTIASGDYSTAMGRNTSAPSYYETALGSYNTNYTPVFSDDWDANDRLFVVGNGTNPSARSNALTILKNANTTIGGSLTINGNVTNTSITFPNGRGTSGQVLSSDGIGGISWVSPAGGTVTEVSGTAPIVSTGGATPVISIDAATTLTAGSMSAADKTRLDGLVSSQWTTSGSNIYYNAGNVGIGTSTTNGQLQLGNTVLNRKIVLYQETDNDHQFYGFGINSNTLRYQVLGGSDSHVFYAGTSPTTSNELFRIQGDGQITIPALTSAGVLLNSSTGLVSSSVGSSGQVLTTNGSGGISWTSPSGGTVTDVSGTAPISVATGTSTPVISIAAATTSTAGSMSAADKTKLEGIDGSETRMIAGTNITIEGSGTSASPYIVNSIKSVTQIQRNALTPVEGLIVYNSTTKKPNFYNGTEWMNYDGTSAMMVGDSYQGGIIAYILQAGDPGYVAGQTHGLIASVADVGTSNTWNNGTNTTTGATATALGTGNANTTSIITSQGNTGTYAAKICRDYTGGGYTDWYLPSKDELNKLYLNRTIIGGFILIGYGYWSSSESSSEQSWAQPFASGFQWGNPKEFTNCVRAVRSF